MKTSMSSIVRSDKLMWHRRTGVTMVSRSRTRSLSCVRMKLLPSRRNVVELRTRRIRGFFMIKYYALLIACRIGCLDFRLETINKMRLVV